MKFMGEKANTRKICDQIQGDGRW